eukprot:ANDGO_05807.mRNA.1 Putative glucose-6-phosphate 1-epimerase
MSLRTVDRPNGIVEYELRTQSGESSCSVYSFGAHVTSVSIRGKPVLFVSTKAVLDGTKAIRGGIPLVFPQFGPGVLPQHGFARNSMWSFAKCETLPGPLPSIGLTLRLADSEATRKVWNHSFISEIEFLLSDEAFEIRWRVANTGLQAFSFTCALHTYFLVDAVETVRVNGLAGRTFKDSLLGGQTDVEKDADFAFCGEVDRVYLDVGDTELKLRDGRATLAISKQNMRDVVVWNPHVAKTRATADFDPEDWKRFVCLETGNVASAVCVDAGAQWTGTTSFRPS